MTLVKPKPAGYGFGEKYPSSHANALQAELIKAIDGVGGSEGTPYEPTSEIEIGGSGIIVTGPSVLSGEVSIGDNAGSQLTIYADTFVNRDVAFVAGKIATFNGNVVFNDSIEINDQAQFDDAVNFNSFATFSGTTFVEAAASFQVGCAALFSDDLSVLGDSNLAGVTASSLSVAGVIGLTATTLTASAAVTATLSGPVVLANTVSLTGVLTPSGVGRVQKRTVTLPNADHALTIAEADVFLVPALGTDRTYALSDTGATVGDRIRVNALQNTTANNGVITYGARTWFVRNQTGQIVFIEFVFNGSNWQTDDGVVQDALWDG